MYRGVEDLGKVFQLYLPVGVKRFIDSLSSLESALTELTS